MKTLLSITAMFVCLASTNAQNTAPDFHAIEVDANANVTIVQADSNLVMQGNNAYSPKIENGVLFINSADDYTVKIKNLTALKVTGASSVKSRNTITSPSVTVQVFDASVVNLTVTAKSVTAIVKDASTLKLSGNTDSLNVTATDGSVVKAGDLKAGTVTAIVHDASVAKVWAVQKISARATDSGVISYKGSPDNKNITHSDAGVVKTDNGDTVSSGNDSDDDTDEDNDSTSTGAGSHTFNDGFIGFGFVLGPDNNGATIKYGKSRDFNFGFGGGYKFFKWNGIGADIYYKSTGFYLNQDSAKILPNTITHTAEKMSFNDIGGLVFDRFFIGHMFFDGGFYYEWTFHTRHVTWDDHSGSNNIASSTKSIDRNLSIVNPSAYGLTFRFGSQQGFCFYFNYRMSNLFKQASGAAAGPPELPAYTLGIDVGGF